MAYFRLTFLRAFLLFPTSLPNRLRIVFGASSTMSFRPSNFTCSIVPLTNGNVESVVSLVGR